MESYDKLVKDLNLYFFDAAAKKWTSGFIRYFDKEYEDVFGKKRKSESTFWINFDKFTSKSFLKALSNYFIGSPGGLIKFKMLNKATTNPRLLLEEKL
jgi:hypothetical protein